MLTHFALAVALTADSTHYVILNHGRPAGAMTVVRDADSVVVRYRYQDRQRGPRFETRYQFGPDDAIRAMETRGLGADGRVGAVTERVELGADWVRATRAADTARMRGDPGAFYRLRATSPFDDALLARFLLRRPGQAGRLLPTGIARVEVAADTTVAVSGGRRRVRLAVIDGLGLAPAAVWLDDRDQLFASSASWFITVPRGAESVLPVLREIEAAYRARRSAALARRLTGTQPPSIAIRGGDLFDSERGVIRPRTTVVIEGERIVTVAPADSVRIPAGARVIDAAGKTVIPGLWDMHTHALLGSEEGGLLHLAAGVTTVRDLAADIDVAVSHRDRARAGTLLGPRMILGGFIEGPGQWAGPTEVLVRTEDEARSWVARYDSLGYRQIKLYNLVHADLVPAIVDEARRRGLRVSGHIPRGLSVPAAVRLGFDEVQHVAFLFSTFFQDSLYTPRMRAYSDVATAVGPTFDVDAPRVTELIALLRDRRTVVDGTFNIWQDRARPLADGSDPVFGPTIAWLPPLMQRSMTPGSFNAPEMAARARATSDNYRRLLKRLFDAGVIIVPGTDNTPGLSLHGELEVYERAGIPASSVLQIATIVPARVMKDDTDYGSIAPGKVADIAIVAGKPAERITDLRRTEIVIRGGRVYETRALYQVVGVNPKW